MVEIKRKYRVLEIDRLRAELGITPNKLAGASGCSLATTQAALRGEPRSRNVCERLVNALRALHHPEASHDRIVEVARG